MVLTNEVLKELFQRIFETTETTLRFDGVDNFFTALLSDRTPSLKDKTGAFFIDSEWRVFFWVLHLLFHFRRWKAGIVL